MSFVDRGAKNLLVFGLIVVLGAWATLESR